MSKGSRPPVDKMADRAYRLFRRRMDAGKLTPEQIKDTDARVKHFVGDGPVKIESSVVTPEGLRITCKDGNDARRLYEFVRLMSPPVMHPLYEIHDKVLLLKNPPAWPMPLPERGQFDSA